MNEQQRFLLKSNLKRISQDLLVEDVFSHLQSTFVLDTDDIELIKHEITSRNKAGKLISILLSKDKNYFDHFYNALKYAEYGHLAEELLSGTKSVDIRDDLSESDDDSLPGIETILRDGGVPQSPHVFVKRPLCTSELENALYQLKTGDGYVILHGMAGCGKTVLAANVLYNEELIHTCFPGGIFWVVIGKVDKMKLLMKMQNLCSWLDPDNNHNPKNLEEARNRLRTLFAHEYPRSLLVLDDIWSETDIKYFDVRVRTLITTRNSAIAERMNSLKIKVPLTENLTVKQSQQILAQWVNCDVSQLPPEADLIINECQCYPLAISMIGALLKSRKSRWSYYLSQLQEKKTSKFRSKLSYQYNTLYDTFAVSFDDIPSYLQEQYKMLCIFDEDVTIPLEVLTIFWDLDEEETEDAMDELIDRSLAHSNTTTSYSSYSVHNIQLSFLKEFASRDDQMIEYHKLFVERYAKYCNEKFWLLKDDHYIHWHFVSHLLKANEISMAIDLIMNFHWLQITAIYTTSSCVIGSFNEVIENIADGSFSQKYLIILKDLCRFIRVHSHLVSLTSVDLIQLALCQPPSIDVYNLAKKHVTHEIDTHGKGKKLYFEWKNRPDLFCRDLQLTSQLHEGGVNCCQYSHSVSSLLVISCGVDKTVRLWNSLTGEEILKMEGHTDAVNHCEFSHDDQHIISCSADNSIKIWSTSNGKELRSLEGHTEEVTCCRLSPNGEYIASGSMDRTIKIWDFQTGYLHCTIKQHTDVVNWCCFSHDSKLVASCSNDLSITIWDVGKEEISSVIEGDKDFVSFCMFTSNGNGILATSLNFIHMFSVSDGTLLWYVEAPSDVLSLALSPNQKYLACTHNDMSAMLFDLNDKTFVQSYNGHSSWLNSVSFSCDGNSIVTSSHDGFCKIWNVDYRSNSLEVITNIFDAVFIDENEFVVVAATKTNQIRVFQSHDNICNSDTFTSKITCCVLSDDSKLSGIGFDDGNIKVLDTYSMDIRSNLSKHIGEITIIKFNSNRLLSCSVDNSCIVWCLDQNVVVCVFNGHTDVITCCRFVSNGNMVISSSYDGLMIVWDSRCGDTIFTCSHDDNAVISCEISNNGKHFITCSADSKSRLWNSADGMLKLIIDDHDDAVRCVAISNDDSVFATGSDDGSVKIWNTDNGDLVCECEGHDGWVLDIKFNEINDTILTLSNDIKWFSLDGTLMQTFHVIGNSLRFVHCSKDIKKCITVDNLGYLYVLECIS